MAKTNNKKVLSRISLILSIVMFALALIVLVTSITAHARNDRVQLFGYSFAVVVTNSMYPEIKAGDLIIVKSCNISEIELDQNAVFKGLSGDFKDLSVVHKVVGIQEDDEVGIQLRTKGVNNGKEDDDLVTAANFIGREVFHSTALGNIITFLKNPINWVYVLVFVLAISFVVMQSVKIFKMIKNKNNGKNKDEDKEVEQGHIAAEQADKDDSK